jgi:hypothetical protein
MPIILGMQEAQLRGLQFDASLGHKSMRPYQKSKTKAKRVWTMVQVVEPLVLA